MVNGKDHTSQNIVVAPQEPGNGHAVSLYHRNKKRKSLLINQTCGAPKKVTLGWRA